MGPSCELAPVVEDDCGQRFSGKIRVTRRERNVNSMEKEERKVKKLFVSGILRFRHGDIPTN